MGSSHVLSLLLFLTVAECNAQNCAQPGYSRAPNGRCYKFNPVPQHYDQAENLCQIEGADLVTVHNQRDNDVVLQIATNYSTAIWMGLVCKSLNSCYWADGSQTGDYLNFKNGAPDLQLGNCLYMATDVTYKGQWVSIGCSTSYFSFACQLPSDQNPQDCPSGYTTYNGNCYFVSTTTANELDAETACVRDGGHLTSIHDSQENDFLVNLARSRGYNTSVYIGLQYINGVLTWNDGSSYNYNAFQAPFPSDRFGTCTDLIVSPTSTGGQWMNTVCKTVTLPYVCKVPYSNNTSPTLFPPTCPPAPYFNDYGSVYSPSYPLNYPNDFDCTYILSAPLDDFVHIEFTFFQTDSPNDYLQVFDGFPPAASLLGTLFGVKTGATFNTTQTNTMALRFKTDGSGSAPGYAAKFWSIGPVPVSQTTSNPVTSFTGPTSSPNQCPPNNYFDRGMISSPGWPNQDYGTMLNCTYTLRSSLAQVYLEFGEFDTETCCDTVSIYDGPTVASTKIKSISGHYAPGQQKFQSTGSYLTIMFLTDSLVVDKGWTATFYSIGSGSNTQPFTSPTSFPSTGCESGWVRDTSSTRCYRLFPLGGGQSQNIQNCVQAGGQMASIHSSQTNGFLISYTASALGADDYYVWIGLKNVAGSWGWADASVFDYNNWADGEPNNSHGTCGALKSFGKTGWLAVDCATALGFICERAATN